MRNGRGENGANNQEEFYEESVVYIGIGVVSGFSGFFTVTDERLGARGLGSAVLRL